MQSLIQDLADARRALVGAPLFTVLATATLSLGIGATTAVYSVVSAVVLDPLPYPAPDRLVDVPRTTREDRTRAVSWVDFRDWRERSASFVALAGHMESEGTFEWEGGAEAVPGARVTRDFFEVMGVVPVLGRTFSEEEDRIHGLEAVILGHGIWVDRFGGDPDVVGRTVPLDGTDVPVVGVMPESFAAPGPDTRFWKPLKEDEVLASVGLPTGTRTLSFITVVGRLAPAISLDDAEERLRTMSTALDEELARDPDRRLAPVMIPLLEAQVGDVEATLLMILAAAALVLLVATANVAGLALSRSAQRQRELAVRTALGARRGRLVRQLLTESATLAVLAGVAGLVIAATLQRVFVGLAPPGLPRIDAVGLGADALLVAAAATLASGLLFGLVPSLGAGRAKATAALGRSRGSSAGQRALRPQRVLVAFQVGIAVLLLSGAALLTQSFSKLSSVELGFEPGATVVATLQPSESRYASADAIDALYAEVLTAVRALPQVASATTTYSPPLVGNGFETSVTPQGVEPDPDDPITAGSVIVRDDYFETSGIPIVAGREFDGTERLGEPPVAIVSGTMAERLWPSQDPLGQRFVLTGGFHGSAESFDDAFFPSEPYTVIGVAGDVRREGHGSAWSLEYYRPHAQIPWDFQYLLVRTPMDVADLAPMLREIVWGVDPTIPVRTVRTMDSYVSESVATPRFRVMLVGGFAAITCLLAMVGLYAVMALAVARRTREMGIRLALGAERGSVVRGVLASGMRVAAVGAGLGLVAAWYANRALSTMLFELEPTDPVTYLGVALAVGVVAVLACYGPARRAAHVDPVTSLRVE